MSAAGTAIATSSLKATQSDPQPSPPGRSEIDQCTFASTRHLSHAEMLGAPVRWPRPSRLEGPLDVPHRKLADGLQALGLTSVGALLEHTPRDSRDARTVRDLKAGEQATVAVQVLSLIHI